MSGNSTTTQTQTKDPWAPTQPYLKQVLADTKGVYESGQGFDTFPGQTVVPYANQTVQAMQGIENLANQGNPLATAAQQNALGVIGSGGVSQEGRDALQGSYDVATGAREIGGQQGYQDLISQANDNLGAYARGEYISGGSPQFNKTLDYQSGQLADDINRGFSNAGRYGSDSHTNAVGDSVGRFRDSAMSGEIAREQGLQQSAANSLFGQNLQGLGALGNIEGANISNTVSAGQGFNTAMGQGQQIAGQYTGMTPSIYNQQFSPFQQLGNVGSQYEDLARRQIEDNVNRFNSEQQAPWTRLANYNALASGAGQLGGTQSTSTPGPSALQTILGTGVKAAGMFL